MIKFINSINTTLIDGQTSVSHRLFLILLTILPATFPFHHQLSSPVAVGALLMWIISGRWKNLRFAWSNRFFLFFTLLFFITLGSLLYSEAFDFFLIEKKLFLLLFPPILSGLFLDKKDVTRMLYSFVIGCTIASVYSLSHSLSVNFSLNRLSVFVNDLYSTEMTTNAIGISHVYFGMYLSFAVVILFYFVIYEKQTMGKFIGILTHISFLLFFMFLIGGKMSIISLLFLLFLTGVTYSIRTKRWLIGALLVIFPIIAFWTTLNYSSYTKGRFQELLNPQNYFVGDNAWNSIGARISIFKCAIQGYHKSPIFGTGVGDVQNDLNRCYSDLNFTSLMDMNAHNQYVQLLLGSGVIGLGFFCAILFYAIVSAYRRKNWIYIYFIFVFALCCLTESVLERQHGVIFFSFFNSLLFFNPRVTSEAV
jgi:O-antigen ligase